MKEGDIVTVLEFSVIVSVTIVTINADAATPIFQNTGHVHTCNYNVFNSIMELVFKKIHVSSNSLVLWIPNFPDVIKSPSTSCY